MNITRFMAVSHFFLKLLQNSSVLCRFLEGLTIFLSLESFFTLVSKGYIQIYRLGEFEVIRRINEFFSPWDWFASIILEGYPYSKILKLRMHPHWFWSEWFYITLCHSFRWTINLRKMQYSLSKAICFLQVFYISIFIKFRLGNLG